ncbi:MULTISPECIES: MerR family transcriptional regulator [unclassified Amycolatopsis]|uniref:MerR family transcriptional regulator n=1 Tax=unclassified Amycolatopsis TaxID=2618356 RepID=UPI0028752A98|nr:MULTISPECIES: MerR family transcriptional regulator [unclassified Amycolatopsis]MDS0134376.1 MerR family transcriptional regulator [Amycolatopsis sp. 505]MDS0148960.1 MerR family transcriptional regulator [Amycolatopsis sp. CM201R]
MDVEAVGGRGSWTPGKVAELLGVSPVTLRTWAARYGVGPSLRDDGRHRRYSDADVRRLQHMQRLIDRGLRAREAAAAVFSGLPDALPDVPAGRRIEELEGAAEGLDFAALAALLDELLDALGPSRAWTDVLVPVLTHLGGRWLRGDVCFESEWALTGEISLALQRYSARFANIPPGRAVVLACCPDERHSLPMEVLRAALVEIGIPAVYLGQLVPAETTAAITAKLDPAAVFLWSMSAGTIDDALVRRLRGRGVGVVLAGPGWENLAGRDVVWVNDLAGAIEVAAERLKA